MIKRWTYRFDCSLTSLTNPLGTFEHTYDPVNLLPKTVTAPNGLVTTFDYHTAAADLRLKEIQHTLAGGLALSKHGYTYSPDGNINTWEQAAGTGPAQTWSLVYDKADQLEAATLGSTTPSVLAQHAWRYDKAGNRISRQQGAQITQTGANHLNQMTSEQPGGWMRVRGTTDEPAKVRVKSNANAFIPAATSGTGGFSAWVQAVAGNNTLTIEAEDFSPQANRRTATYRVQVNGSNRVPGYDFNGNLVDNGAGQTYEWDAENRLVKITYADQTSTEFRYDGQSRRVGITEKDAARVVTSEKRYLWAEGAQPAEERAADGRTVVKQYHAQGEFLPGAVAPLNKVFYTKDHLGSVRELVNGNGTLQTRYDYDLWGGRTKITGTVESEVGYTGHHHHGKSGLVLTWYRAYDPVTGWWLSRDPIGENGGINLYGYVFNNPIGLVDQLGLDVTVGLYEGASGFGHIGVAVNSGTTCGFYPKQTGVGVLLGKDTPGAWGQDTAKQIKNVTIKTTPDQDAAVQKHLDAQKQSPGNYNLYNRNCATQAGEALKAGGIKVPDSIMPRPFFEGIGK